MADKKFTREDYERLTKENMEIFVKLDKQLSEERKSEDEFLLDLSEDERIEYILEESKRIDAESADKFSSYGEIMRKKDL